MICGLDCCGLGLFINLIIGAVIGWLAERLTGRDYNVITSVILGLAGSVLGGLLFRVLGFRVAGIFGEIVAGVIGSVILIAIFDRYQKSSIS